MKKALLGGCVTALFLGYACGADPLYLAETDAVITLRAEGAEFDGKRTYYLPTNIVDLCLQPAAGTPTSEAIGGAAGGPSIDPGNCFKTDHSIDNIILDALVDNMDALGYRRVLEASRDEADVALLVGMVSRSSWSLSRPYCYPTNYYRGCVGQQGNPDIFVPYQGLVIQLIDVEKSSERTLVPLWTAAIHQLQQISAELGTSLGGGLEETKSRITVRGINTAFEQSPYLAEGGTP